MKEKRKLQESHQEKVRMKKKLHLRFVVGAVHCLGYPALSFGQ